MPRLQYDDSHDAAITPRQHMLRALGGPLFNALMLPLALVLRRIVRPGSAGHAAAGVAVATNAFIAGVGLTPLPMIDGGPLLKWSMVARGRTPQQADELVRQVDGAIVPVCAVLGLLALRRRRYLEGGFAWMMGLTSLAYWRGWIKE
jgi:hypothetical protein